MVNFQCQVVNFQCQAFVLTYSSRYLIALATAVESRLPTVQTVQAVQVRPCSRLRYRIVRLRSRVCAREPWSKNNEGAEL